MKVLLLLYPMWWRRRHGDEARAILEHTPISVGSVLDLLRGGLDAWIHQEDPARLPLGEAFGRFTDRARRVMDLAQQEARATQSDFLGTEHLLLGIVSEHDGIGARVLHSLGISPEAIRTRLTEVIGTGSNPPPRCLGITPRVKQSLHLSAQEAEELGHHYLGTEHLLLGLTRERDGIAARVLADLGADHARVREQVVQELIRVSDKL